MLSWPQLDKEKNELPSEIYISLVGSLYSDPRTLLAGAVGTTAAALVTAVKTGEPALWLCTLAIAAISGLRAIEMRAFAQQRSEIRTAEAAARWELRYVIGSAAFVALLGTWCLVAFATTSDPEVQLLSFSMTLVNMIGVAGRNFGSRLLVTAQLICAGGPLLAALLMTGEIYLSVYACVLFPFFVSFKGISDRLRRTFLDAVIATRDVGLLAGRLDTALNNMSHGLCMLDEQRHVVIANSRLPSLLQIEDSLVRPGVSFRTILRECLKAGTLATTGLSKLLRNVEARLSGSIQSPLSIETGAGRTLALTFSPISNGGSVVLVEDVTEQKNAEAQIKYLAHFDALTGLPNRNAFREELDRVLSVIDRIGGCAILFVDLDQFKQVNDTLGHPCGDALLKKVADRLRRIVRETDIIARLGGDEFVVLQSPLEHAEKASLLARRIVEELAEPYNIEGSEVVIGASVGISTAPIDGRDGDVLLKNADMALYRAKSEGRACWRFFEPEMDAKVKARRKLELDLRSAVSNDAFELYYQPLINLKTMKVSACEALLRWPHPERGMISPAEFIPVAEEMGLIVEIGNAVLRKACNEAMRWPSNVSVAVNLSALQLRRSDVVESVRTSLASSRLAPERLELEITESALVKDTEAARAVLTQLRTLGVKISLDDFGTGYSSLSYLHSLPLNKIKIDRSFLLEIESSERSRTLLSGVARLSDELGLSVVAEGIETEEQLALLVRDGHVQEVQGFLFSRAIPGKQIRELLYLSSPASAAAMKVA